MRWIEAALLIAVFLFLRTALKRMPAKYWVIIEGLIFLRLLLPSFPAFPLNVWGTVEVRPVVGYVSSGSKSFFEQINPWMIAALLLWGLLSYVMILKKRNYQGEQDNLYYHDGEEAFVAGLLKPIIYLPLEQDKKKKELLLLHEQLHIRRGDPQLLLFGYLALCLNWYNPLVWVLFLRMRQDMDLACDEAVLRLGVDPKEYGELLIERASSKNILALGIRWFSVKERLRQIKRKKVSIGVGLVLALIILVLLIPFVTGRKLIPFNDEEIIGSGDGPTDIYIETEPPSDEKGSEGHETTIQKAQEDVEKARLEQSLVEEQVAIQVEMEELKAELELLAMELTVSLDRAEEDITQEEKSDRVAYVLGVKEPPHDDLVEYEIETVMKNKKVQLDKVVARFVKNIEKQKELEEGGN